MNKKRECGECTLCCDFPKITKEDSLKKDGTPFPIKKAYEKCQYCVPGNKPCSIYANRPSFCESFTCGWLVDTAIPDSMSPHNTGMVFVLNENIESKKQIISLYEGKPHSWFPNASKFQDAIVSLVLLGYEISVVRYGDGLIITKFGWHSEDDLQNKETKETI